MKKVRKFKAAVALGSLTAAVALFAGAPDANAQTAPGGGSFPGSFLVPGTNTSIKVGGYVKIVGIYDMSARGGATNDVDGIPLEGSANHTLHGALNFHARQSTIAVDTRTPTAYGDLTTFFTIDAFGSQAAQGENTSNTQNMRVNLAYGTLGGFLAGQAVSLWADNDAVIESVDPTGHVATMDGLSQRQPQFRYTYAMPNGISIAGSIENPEAEGISSAGAPFTTNSGGSLGGIDRVPDFVARGRIDQAWGHFALTGLYRDLKVIAPAVARIHKNAYGIEGSGHINTFGKDALKFTVMWGKGLGHYMSNMRDTASNALQADLATGAATVATSYGANIGYTHWWTTALRSSAEIGLAKFHNNTGIFATAAALTNVERRQLAARANLIWSPVPQVDLGIEYFYARRTTETSKGNANRLEVESVFKF